MTKVYCADVSCRFCNDDGVCTAKNIALAWSSVMTMYEGRQEFNKCKSYEESEFAKRAKKFFRDATSDGDNDAER